MYALMGDNGSAKANILIPDKRCMQGRALSVELQLDNSKSKKQIKAVNFVLKRKL